ncbi:MAG: hypothetical protein HY719_11945 [Planctomycetes bacterium]|nr:hypothetical protein [Planctomycetota bacterium]
MQRGSPADIGGCLGRSGEVMPPVRVQVELNRGRGGVPLDQLAAFASGTAEFLSSLATDIGIKTPPHCWVSEDFDNGSLKFACRLDTPLDATQATRFQRGLRSVLRNDYSDTTISVCIRPETRLRYARVAQSLEADTPARFGLSAPGAEGQIEWFVLTPTMVRDIQAPVESAYRSFGEVQGVVHAFFKETSPPYLKIRELSTKQMVNCIFGPELYADAVKLLADPSGVVFVEGWLSESAETGLVERIDVTGFRVAPEFDEAIYRKSLGGMSEFTGNLTTTEYLRELRRD